PSNAARGGSSKKKLALFSAWPGLSRPSTSWSAARYAWMPGTSGARRRRSSSICPRRGSGDEPAHRLHGASVREHFCRKRLLVEAQVVPEHALEHGPYIGGRLEVTALEQVRFLEARPVGDDAAALERAAGEQRDRRGAVVGPVGAIDTRGAAEL